MWVCGTHMGLSVCSWPGAALFMVLTHPFILGGHSHQPWVGKRLKQSMTCFCFFSKIKDTKSQSQFDLDSLQCSARIKCQIVSTTSFLVARLVLFQSEAYRGKGDQWVSSSPCSPLLSFPRIKCTGGERV